MDESHSIFDLPSDAAHEVHADRQARSEIEAGLGVEHRKVREWLSRLNAGEKVSPPSA